ncbi:alpha/beta hydrolase fold domain-containing protein [Sphingomonas sp. RIT328]|uniref:alpha/beta hydrolase fold domain-containing protein n=1 Tax=Sphingomonas sp. RIT328 TaxID=1470591 RepID=UPI00044DE8AB|nr:alpha/beta hydrolase fold domain-containing protein [Sphingomonas sp. RIT328]EZP50032.1 Alpha/beta hydrolase fold family protein [Sphingomonas sp. RIT328]
MVPPPEFAAWVSPAAGLQFDEVIRRPAEPPRSLEDRRRHYDSINALRLEEALGAYPASVVRRLIGGVPVHDVRPTGADRSGTLICLHGGAFLWGAGAGAALEAVPVAAATGMRVVAVDYRLAPEHPFPAAVDDALAVHAALLAETEGPIGVYGCSAGAYLTAQLVARLIAEGRPSPQAVAMLHGSGLEVGGDSLALAGQLNGHAGAADIHRMHDLPYFAGSDPADPLVFPGDHPAMLAAFPPTLLITGTRDFAASSASVMHRRLLSAGVDARFVMFDGLWHAHHVDTTLPESQEVYGLMAAHFDDHMRRD